MSTIRRDPLLLSAEAILSFLTILLVGVTALLAFVAIAFPIAMLILPANELSGELGALSQSDTAILIATIMCMAALTGLFAFFFRQLWRVVGSVGEGDPFIPANATRLTRMAWALVASYGAMIGIVLGFYRVSAVFGQPRDEIELTFGSVDLGGLLTILLLFILARVFKHGAAMRDDLEGTV